MVLVKVGQKEIDKGEKGNCFGCPIGLAIEEATGEVGMVQEKTVTINNRVYRLPAKAITFLREFDNWKKVQPFEFELDYPR